MTLISLYRQTSANGLISEATILPMDGVPMVGRHLESTTRGKIHPAHQVEVESHRPLV